MCTIRVRVKRGWNLGRSPSSKEGLLPSHSGVARVSTVTQVKGRSIFALRRSTLDFCLGGQRSWKAAARVEKQRECALSATRKSVQVPVLYQNLQLPINCNFSPRENRALLAGAVVVIRYQFSRHDLVIRIVFWLAPLIVIKGKVLGR